MLVVFEINSIHVQIMGCKKGKDQLTHITWSISFPL
jgi:hypothetical protein